MTIAQKALLFRSTLVLRSDGLDLDNDPDGQADQTCDEIADRIAASFDRLIAELQERYPSLSLDTSYDI